MIVFVDLHDERPEPNWADLARRGVVGAYLKLGEGESRIGGLEAEARSQRARAQGLFVGFYWFARPDLGHSAVAEADAFAAALQGSQRVSDWRPVLDLERGLPVAMRGSVGRWGADVLHRLNRCYPRSAWYSSLAQARTMPELYAWGAWISAWGRNDGTVHVLPAVKGLTVFAQQYTSLAAIGSYRGDASVFRDGRVARMLGRR